MDFRLDKGTGYMYAYCPSHPSANAAGKVMEHVVVMEQNIGRNLIPGECVHHKDRDKTNNKIENLRLMSIEDHARLHAEEDLGVVFITLPCTHCGKLFETTSISERKYCSAPCSQEGRRRFLLTREELNALVWKMPTTEVAKMLGVSDTAIAKRCKKLGINKPSRGYWSKESHR